jgi:hypothetical protein
VPVPRSTTFVFPSPSSGFSTGGLSEPPALTAKTRVRRIIQGEHRRAISFTVQTPLVGRIVQSGPFAKDNVIGKYDSQVVGTMRNISIPINKWSEILDFAEK